MSQKLETKLICMRNENIWKINIWKRALNQPDLLKIAGIAIMLVRIENLFMKIL